MRHIVDHNPAEVGDAGEDEASVGVQAIARRHERLVLGELAHELRRPGRDGLGPRRAEAPDWRRGQRVQELQRLLSLEPAVASGKRGHNLRDAPSDGLLATDAAQHRHLDSDVLVGHGQATRLVLHHVHDVASAADALAQEQLLQTAAACLEGLHHRGAEGALHDACGLQRDNSRLVRQLGQQLHLRTPLLDEGVHAHPNFLHERGHLHLLQQHGAEEHVDVADAG
mmetsp:Transcript_139376/g.433614  ORF Transcript_139376/g.433614 Transcript_139376/m.433614 type:complete len:226 (-) Transcript_139376:722-1399(-)